MRKFLLGLAVLSVFPTAYSTSYAPSPTTEFFQNFAGEWKSEPTGERPHLSITRANYSLMFGMFQISHSESDGNHDSGWIVQIVEQKPGELHAIFLSGGVACYFKGRIEGNSKAIPFEALFPDLNQPGFLTVDFSKCPDSPPTATLSKTKPGR